MFITQGRVSKEEERNHQATDDFTLTLLNRERKKKINEF